MERTTPTPSCPSTEGQAEERRPLTVCRSEPQTVAAVSRTRVSPGPGWGSGTWTDWNSAPPRQRTAVAAPLTGRLRTSRYARAGPPRRRG
ncbi:hypothetical protein ACFFX0_13405 [Citricoccus parietis]|uniref:Uncharacterized protein n=1 Tax=Citricoccus parietis TaxID=592307 RepID=A0ABV5FZS3_9MICC